MKSLLPWKTHFSFKIYLSGGFLHMWRILATLSFTNSKPRVPWNQLRTQVKQFWINWAKSKLKIKQWLVSVTSVVEFKWGEIICFIFSPMLKVKIFWETHKILRNLHRRWFVLFSNGQIYILSIQLKVSKSRKKYVVLDSPKIRTLGRFWSTYLCLHWT